MILLFDAVIPCRCWYGGWLDCVIDKFIIWIVDDCVPFFSYYIHCLKHIHCVVDASLDVFEIYIIAKLFVQYKNLVGDICPACIWVFSDALEHRSAQKHQFLVFLLAWARAFWGDLVLYRALFHLAILGLNLIGSNWFYAILLINDFLIVLLFLAVFVWNLILKILITLNIVELLGSLLIANLLSIEKLLEELLVR